MGSAKIQDILVGFMNTMKMVSIVFIAVRQVQVQPVILFITRMAFTKSEFPCPYGGASGIKFKKTETILCHLSSLTERYIRVYFYNSET
jgi:hypothetical protein